MPEPIISSLIPTTGSNSGSVEKFIQISNGCFARTFGNSDWTTIRMAVRWRLVYLTGSTANITGDPDWAWGFCHGTINIPGTKYVQNFVGMKLDDTTVSILADNAGYRLDYNRWATRTSGSVSYTEYAQTHGSVISYETIPSATSSIDAMFFDITRGPDSGSYTASFYRQYGSFVRNSIDYYSLANFLTDIESLVPGRSGWSRVSYSSQSYFIIDETTYGELDSVCVWWGKSDPVFQIEDLYVVRLE